MTLDTHSSPPSGLTGEQLQIYLAEYEKAQDSAQHHDMLVWSISSLNWVGSAILMGLVLGGLSSASQCRQKVVLLAISAVGVWLAILVWRWTCQLRYVKVWKYNRCKEIEALLGMKQHSGLPYKAGSQTKFNAVLMVLFILAWCVLIMLVVTT